MKYLENNNYEVVLIGALTIGFVIALVILFYDIKSNYNERKERSQKKPFSHH
ncbi:hypothetical protein [Flavobacterium degerlachei]|jgi:hypothetical protein|uniref:Uncharacterized protein n=1 Tax=Flavobacterium degerlachei TaxID=229203 RepID=A0A1H3B182_9FLAO|nr:hypothetical protein [Flavobacterium degerlachei]SDX35687.1 hypothetical protein SAMN05444338_109127 [Flavobacterium degerlachei]